MKSDNVYLPVKLDWDDVRGWRDSWKEEGECIQVLDCEAEDKACFKAPSDGEFEEKSDNLEECKKDCRNDCYNKVLGVTINGYWLSPYKILEFYREECLKNCTIECRKEKDHMTNAKGCKEKCPHQDTEEEDRDYCYLQKKEPSYKNFVEVPVGDGTTRLLFLEGYAQSYVIKIMDEHYQEGKKKEDYEKGEIKDPEAQKKIDVRKKLIQEEEKKEETDVEQIWEWQEEIREIRENELHINSWIEPLRQSEFLPPSPCFFKSNRTYDWQVRACCPFIKEVMSNEDFAEEVEKKGETCPNRIANMILDYKKEGVWVESALDEDCGPWSDEWKFITNLAPEPKLPYDPDWVADGFADGFHQNIPPDVLIEWCPFTECDSNKTWEDCIEASEDEDCVSFTDPDEEYCILRCYFDHDYGACRGLTYQFFTYLIKNGEEECHPFALMGDECTARILNPSELGAERTLRFHPPWFSNNAYLYFTKDHLFSWHAASCEDLTQDFCTEFGQKWQFSLADFLIETTSLTWPPDTIDPAIGIPIQLEWKATSPGAVSFRYEIYNEGTGAKIDEGITLIYAEVDLDFDSLDLNTIYKWRVRPCWGYEAELEKCGEWSNDTFGDYFYFKTTGQPPQLLKPDNNADNMVIPVTFEWQEVGGAKSYVFEINGQSKIIHDRTEITLDYPELLQETDYQWQVKTCARVQGETCGDPSESRNFRTFKLEAPTNPNPADGDAISTPEMHTFSWKSVEGAKHYQFQIEYVEAKAELRQECQDKVGEIITKLSNTNSVMHQIECGGDYQWRVRGCMVAACEDLSTIDWAETELWTVRIFSPDPIHKIIEEFFINEVSPQVFEETPERIASETKNIIYSEIVDLIEGIMDDIINEVIDRLRDEASGPADIPGEIDGIFQAVWQGIYNNLDINPDRVPEARLRELLVEKINDVLNIPVSDEVDRPAVTGAADMDNALIAVADILNSLLKEDIPEEIAEEISQEIYDKVLEITKDIPQALLDAVLAAIPDIPSLEEAWDFLKDALEQAWQIEADKAIAEGELQGVPREILEEALDNILAAMINNVENMVLGEIPQIAAKAKIMAGGLIPCGQPWKNPDRPWLDETEKCGIKHLFILAYIIIDFFLWRIIPIILILLGLASGAIFYFSLQTGDTNPLIKVKALWRAAGIGLAVIFFAWMAVSIFLSILGYQLSPWNILLG